MYWTESLSQVYPRIRNAIKQKLSLNVHVWFCKRSDRSLHMHWPHWAWLTICSEWIYSLKNSSFPWYCMSDVIITLLYLLCSKSGFGQTEKSHSSLDCLIWLQRHGIVLTQFIILHFKGLSLFWKDGTKKICSAYFMRSDSETIKKK